MEEGESRGNRLKVKKECKRMGYDMQEIYRRKVGIVGYSRTIGRSHR